MHVDTSEGGAVMSRCGFRSVRYLEVKIRCKKRFGTKDSVCCSEFRGGRFSEVANVLQVWDFQSVTRTLSAQGGSTVFLLILSLTKVDSFDHIVEILAGFCVGFFSLQQCYSFIIHASHGVSQLHYFFCL